MWNVIYGVQLYDRISLFLLFVFTDINLWQRPTMSHSRHRISQKSEGVLHFYKILPDRNNNFRKRGNRAEYFICFTFCFL